MFIVLQLLHDDGADGSLYTAACLPVPPPTSVFDNKKVIQRIGPLVFGIDETIERRWGRKIAARGIYRDAVRSSKSHFVKASGLRSLMWLTTIPWAQRVDGVRFYV